MWTTSSWFLKIQIFPSWISLLSPEDLEITCGILLLLYNYVGDFILVFKDSIYSHHGFHNCDADLSPRILFSLLFVGTTMLIQQLLAETTTLFHELVVHLLLQLEAFFPFQMCDPGGPQHLLWMLSSPCTNLPYLAQFA
ncbi:hypothetical protein KP509_29G008500 [Ceratopteris richardii]|uniref:Uncharacterized protein n=1 Tax=Ceratopteris richardii TaxID=49495 RepID=A0A8T2R638_CERRI|nr:hypothetical protein KP509_29G008500 [Ceratopteris richardii]